MPRDGSGNYTRTNANFSGPTTWQQQADSPNKVIAADQHDTHDQDMADALTGSVARDGQSPMTGALSMGGNRITNVGTPTANTDAATYGIIPTGRTQVRNLADQAIQAGFVFDVTDPDYGAVGDGVADDTAAIQAAINAAQALGAGAIGVGSMVYFPPARDGTQRRYRTTSPLLVTVNGIYFAGAGMYNVVIDNDSANQDTIFFNKDAVSTFINGGGVFDLSFNYVQNDPTAGAHIHLKGTAGIHIVRVRALNHYQNILLNGRISNTHITDCTTNGGEKITTAPAAGSAQLRIQRAQTENNGTAIQDPADNLWYDEPNETMVTGCNFRNNSNADPSSVRGSEHGISIGACDGFYMTGGHVMGGSITCLHYRPEQSNLPLVSAQFAGVHFDPKREASTYGIWYQASGLTIGGNMARHEYVGCSVTQCVNDLFRCDENLRKLTWSGGGFAISGRYGVVLTAGRDLEFGNFYIQSVGLDTPQEAFSAQGVARDVIVNGLIVDNAFRGVRVAGDARGVVVSDCIVHDITDTTAYAAYYFSQTLTDEVKLSNCRSEKGQNVASAATLQLPVEHDMIFITGNTNISDIDVDPAGGSSVYQDRVVTLIFGGALSVLSTGNLFLNGGLFAATANSTLTLRYRTGTWHEVGRMNP